MLRLLTLIVLLAVVAAPGMAADSGPARSAALSAATLANDAGVPAGRFFQNRNYNYELVERTGSAILHHWFDYQAGEWRRGARFGSSVSGQPVFLQDASSTNNYELVVYEAGSRVRHYTFSMASGSWQRRTAFGTNVRGDPVMFQNRYNGNYEVVVKEGSWLHHYWLPYGGDGRWQSAETFGRNITATPAIFQNRNGNYELVAREGTLLHHYWFDAGTGHWQSGDFFAFRGIGSPVMFQNRNNDDYQLVVCDNLNLQHYWFRSDLRVWGGPSRLGSATDTVGFAMFQNRAPGNYNYELLVTTKNLLGLDFIHMWYVYPRSVWWWAGYGNNEQYVLPPLLFQNRAPGNYNYEMILVEQSAGVMRKHHYYFDFANGFWRPGATFD